MENKNFSFKQSGKDFSNQKQINPNNINIDYQTTEPNSTNIQKQKKLCDDIITLSSNLNLNLDINENSNNNNISDNINNKNDYHLIYSNLNPSLSQLSNNQDLKNVSDSKANNINIIKGQHSKKINELINKFNNLYSSDNNENIQNFNNNINNNNLNDNKEINNNYYTINNNDIDINGNLNQDNNINNLSSDNIMNRNNINIDLNKNTQIKSVDNLNKPNREIKKDFNPERKISNYTTKKNSNYQINYYTNKNKYMNRVNNLHSFIKPKPKSHSTNQMSRSYKNSPERRLLNKFYLNQNNTSELSTISIKANMVINEFKKTLLEAEKMENELNKSKYSLKSYAGIGANGNNIINTFNNMNLNQTNTDTANNSYLNTNNNISKINYNDYKDNNFNDINLNDDNDIYDDKEIEKIKIQNLILIKSNQDLKNQNKILSHEINSYKNSSLYKNPFTQYDKDLNIFIQDLKTSLENATQNNQDLENIINNIQKENKILNDKNQKYATNFELAKKECEKLAKENSELKVDLENKTEEINKKDNNLIKLEKEINNLNNIVNDNKNQINYLNSIQESNKASQKDNEDLILDLKNTIENLQKLNLDNNNEILDLKNKIEEYKNNINSKQNEIITLNEAITEKEIIIKNKDNQISEFNNLINETKNKNIQNKNEIHSINIENEKLKNEIKTIKMLLADRERTITAQKNSISFLTKTFNKNINLINNNITNAMNNEENENIDKNKGLKLMVDKMKKEIYELNKKNNKNEKEKKQLEKDLSEFNEQYEQIKYDYQLLYQKYIEQNKVIEILKNEFLKRNNDNELQHLTKVNFDILGKLKKSENENIIKTQQIEQLKKNYELINNQFIEFTKNNYNNYSNNYSETNNNENDDISINLNNKNKIKNLEIDNNIPYNNILNNENENNIKLMDSQNIDDNLFKYSNNNNSEKLNFNKDNLNYINDEINDINDNDNEKDIINEKNINNNDINDILKNKKNIYLKYNDIELNNNKSNNNINDEKDEMNNINLKNESIENVINASDENNNDFNKFNSSDNDNRNNINNKENILNSERINIYNNNEINYSEEIKEKLTEDNNSLSDLQNKFNYSSQMQMNKIDLLNNQDISINNNEYKSQSLPVQLKNDKNNLLNVNNNINNKYKLNNENIYLKESENHDLINNENINSNIDIKNIEKDQSLIPYPNIYTLRGNKIINFNLFEKKFILINPKDNTKDVFNIYLSKNTSPPLTLNTSNGFFILLNDYIFIYNPINNTINILTKLLSSHQEGGFIDINNEIYSISGKDCLLCEKYSYNNNKNIKLPSVNFARINSGLCNINNDYLYIFFGNKCENSIERLNLSINYETMKEYINNWEHMQINSVMENGDKINLERFTLFLDDYNNVIILGGNDNNGNANQDIYGLNLSNNEISAIGKIDTSALYIGQNIQLDESIFAIYDTRNGLHFFNKELDYHEIYNFNM